MQYERSVLHFKFCLHKITVRAVRTLIPRSYGGEVVFENSREPQT